MKTTFLNIIMIFLIILTSCQNRNNIAVTGQIIEEVSGKPIPNAEVVILCWYRRNLDDASFEKKTLITDSDGKYQAKFEKGYKVDVASKKDGFLPFRSYNELNKNEIEINLRLTEKKENPTLISLLNTDKVISDSIPFLKVRIPVIKEGEGLDFENTRTFGFDFKTLRTNSDTTQTDIWFRIENKEGKPTTFATPSNGGLIPIFQDDIKSSLLYELTIAPTIGYVTSYNLTGSEEGFFVRCRDGKTFGKIIFEKTEISLISPDVQGSYFKEFRKNFSSLYQPNGTTDLFYSQTNIDLVDFLVDYRY